MMKRPLSSAFVVILTVAVCVLGTHAATHWHDNPADQAQCQICHIGQSVIPQPAIQAQINPPLVGVGIELPDEPRVTFDSIRAVNTPRAPPA